MPTFVKTQVFFLVASMVIPAVCVVAALLRVADPLLLSNIGLPAVLLCWILALLTPWVIDRTSDLNLRRTGFVLGWAAIAIVFPLSWDLPWAILHAWVNGATAFDVEKWYFWAYGVADTRYLRGDPIIVIVEYWSGAIALIELAFLTLFVRNRITSALRCFVATSCLGFYGCTIFFGSEFIRGMSDVPPDLFSYIKFAGLNAMWVVIPPIAGVLLLKLVNDPKYVPSEAIARLVGRTTRSDGVDEDQEAMSR
ncbi:hypothetical protein [Mycolicibacterium mageritense]